MRVAMGLALEEDNPQRRAKKVYDVLWKLEFTPSTPTLFHSGSTHPQLSSCYLTTVSDDLGHIFDSYNHHAHLSKWSGGLGNDWTNLRASGALIESTGVESTGVVPFLRISNDVTAAINRSGKRRGAACGYLACWHLDFPAFIDLKRNTGDERRRTPDMNTAAWIPDLFMKRVENGEEWTLFSPTRYPTSTTYPAKPSRWPTESTKSRRRRATPDSTSASTHGNCGGRRSATVRDGPPVADVQGPV